MRKPVVVRNAPGRRSRRPPQRRYVSWRSPTRASLAEVRNPPRAGGGRRCSHSSVRHGSSRVPTTVQRSRASSGQDLYAIVHFVYVDLPPSLRRWKRGQRGVRLYYLLWQRAALREARRISLRQPFDLAWHLTLANGWIGSAACLLNMPFVYGPVGGGVSPPWRLASSLGAKGTFYELLRAAARVSGRYFNPLARASWRRASLILVQNEETRRWLPRRHQSKVEVFPNVILERLPSETSHAIPRVMLFAGRLLPLKGVSLAIRALDRLPGWRLIVCGDGPDASRLRLLARDRRLEDRVEFRGWVERAEVLRTMREEASVFVFPSLHDEAGWVVAEAMASGLPVVCLDLGGPPTLAGRRMAVAPAGSKVTAERIAQRVLEATETNPESIRERASECLFVKRLDRLESLLRTRGLLAAFHSREAPSQTASANGRAVAR